MKYATSPLQALEATKQLIKAWPHARPPDPEGWVASLAAKMSTYPLGVVQECCDPRVGLATVRDFPPTVESVTAWCDKRLKYHRGMVRWGEQVKPEREFSAEHRKSMLERWAVLLKGLLQKPQSETAE